MEVGTTNNKTIIIKSINLKIFLCNQLKLFRILSDAKELSTFPHLNGTSALEVLRLDRAGLNHVPASLCNFCPKLKSL